MTHRPKVARGELSILTPAQADAIESLELDDERDAPMAEALLAMLGIEILPHDGERGCRGCGTPFNNADAPPNGLCAACSPDYYDASTSGGDFTEDIEEELDAEAEHIRRQEIADWEASRGSQ